MPALIYKDLGSIDYKEAWDYQEKLFQELLAYKRNNLKTPNHLLFCEHPPVFTLGRSGSQQNLLVNEELLKKRNIGFYRINRGGDITFHGPGQVVGYPIIDLEQFSLGIKDYILLLEEAVIRTLGYYGITGERLIGATGVWLDTGIPSKARKICAIGVRASRHVTMHGFAFNVNTDLSYYQYINPCGFTDKDVTSMEKELGRKQDMDQVKSLLRSHLEGLLENSRL
jgi:lipoyl(octanoyl) transferase